MFSATLPLLYGLLAIGQARPESAAPAPSVVAGQTDVPTEPGPVGIDPPSAGSGDVFVGKDRDGRFQQVPLDEALQSSAEFLRSLEADGSAAPAPVYISRFFLEGDVVGERARFKASISVEITRPEGWYDVPLGLHEAHIHESTYEGPGSQAPRTGGPVDDGLYWTMHGLGTHRLNLHFDVPLKQSPAGQQLQLRLPQLPNLFRPRCLLRIPGGPVVVTTRSGAPVPVHPLDTGGQEVDLDISTPRLDLTWRQHTDETPTLSTVVTSFDVRRSGERLEFVATQQCDVEQGAVTRIEVRLPTDNQLRLDSLGRRIGLTQPAAILRHSEMEGRPGWMQVELDEPMSGRFELEWNFTRPFPQSGDRILVDGLELASARIQKGRVEVQPFDGYDLRRLEQEGSGLQKTNPVSKTALQAFEFRRQPFQLQFDILRIQPKLVVTPRYFLQLDTDHAELFLELQVLVLAGVVDEMLIDGPFDRAGDWHCSSAGVEAQFESGVEQTSARIPTTVVTGATGQSPGAVRLQLSPPVYARPADAARLRLVVPFSRNVLPVETELNLTLPRLSGAAEQPGSLFITGGLKLEPSIDASSSPLDKLPPPATIPAGIPVEFARTNVLGFSLTPGPAPLQIEWVAHSRLISAETSLSISELRAGAVNVVQRVSYAVSYGEVSSLLIELPPMLDELFPPGVGQFAQIEDGLGILFRSADGTFLDAERIGANLRISLPAPQHGPFDLMIDYVLPVPAAPTDQPASFELPIVRALDAEFGRILVYVHDSERVRLADSEQGWTLRAPRSQGVAWQTGGQRSSVRLTIDESLLGVPQQYTIKSAFLLSRLGEQGEIITLGEYEVQDAPRRLLIMLPHAEGPVEFHWDGELLKLHREILPVDGALDQYTLDLPPGDGDLASGRLSVKYRSPSRGVIGLLTRRSIDFPRFPSKVWVSETWFEVVLPAGSQLFDPPPDMSPQYTWQRKVAVWMRQFTPRYEARRAALLSASDDPQLEVSRGNRYAFNAVGTVTRATVGAMSQSLIVLIGAGLTLFLGFLFGRVPATRNVLSLLVLAFLFALASVWHLELMQLLVQPALLGLLLAVVATAFDKATRRRLAWARPDTTFDHGPIVEPGSPSSGLSPLSPPAARTAVYRAAGGSESGGTP
jgi:hypothetical protein